MLDLNLSKQYYNEYIEKNKENSAIKSVFERIFLVEEKSQKSILDWDYRDVEDYLIEFHSISTSSLNKSLNILRDFTKFVAKKEGIALPPKHKLGDNRLCELIDKDKLMNVVINYEQYQYIKNQLKTINNENVRDVVIFELAWVGLTSNEIRNLKESHIKFEFIPDFDWEVAYLSIVDSKGDIIKEFKVESPEVVEDIKTCLRERFYYVTAKNGAIKKMDLRFSADKDQYLIKPVLVGRNKKEAYISNPSFTLHGVFKQNEITCPGINVDELSIEDIRRSKIIYLLAPQNRKYFNFDFVNSYFDFGNSDATLFWLRKIANWKYPIVNQKRSP